MMSLHMEKNPGRGDQFKSLMYISVFLLAPSVEPVSADAFAELFLSIHLQTLRGEVNY